MNRADARESYWLDRPEALTCPEWGGAMRPEQIKHFLRRRCHIGHVIAADTMVAAHLSSKASSPPP